MSLSLDFQSVDVANSEQIQEIVNLWNMACGNDLAITQRLVTYNLRPNPGGDQIACIALHNGQPIRFISTSYLNDPTVVAPHSGWIDAIAVAPDPSL